MKKQLKTVVPSAIALLTLAGIAVHDTKIDALTKFAIALPVVVATYEGAQALTLLGLGGDPHTHVERASGERASKDASGMPRVTPRQNEDKKYRLNKAKQGNNPPFDDYGFPAVA